MVRIIFLLLAAALFTGACGIESREDEGGAPGMGKEQMGMESKTERINLGGVWKFEADPYGIGISQSWQEPGFDDTAWRDITVPGSWNFQFRNSPYPEDDHDYDGPAWYRLKFTPEESQAGSHVILSFQAVCYKTTVWLNGKLLGTHEGDFLPFEYDVSSDLEQGKENVLALYIETINSASKYTIPPAILRYDYWIYSGVHRDVFLERSGRVKVYDIFANGKPAGSDGDVAVESWILNASPEPVRIEARAIVRLKGGGDAGNELSQTLEIPVGTIAKTVFRLRTGSPKLWSPESPALYTVKIDLEETDAPVTVTATEAVKYNPEGELPPRAMLTPVETDGLDAAETDFGIRSIEVRGVNVYLNGEQLQFRGINRHDEYPMLGRTIPDELCRNDLIMMKRANMNTLRTAHYPNNPKVLRMADELGLLVFEEIPATGLRPWEMCSNKVKKLADDCMRRMVVRDRNHPSVAVWGVGNEFEPTAMTSYTTPLYRMVKSIDPTRLVSYNRAMFDLTSRDPESDLIILNPYFGWYFGRVEDTSLFLNIAHTLFPKKPIVIGEFGADAIRCRRTNQEPSTSPHFTEDYQVWHLKRTWETAIGKPYVCGGMIWVYADFLSPKRKYLSSSQVKSNTLINPVPYHNTKGIVDNYRIPKNSYLAVMGMFGGLTVHDMAIEVRDASGYSVPDADVDVYLEDGTLACRQKTDAGGRVVLWYIPERLYRVAAFSGAMKAEKEVFLDTDSSISLMLE
jgi:hypothetical protein